MQLAKKQKNKRKTNKITENESKKNQNMELKIFHCCRPATYL